MKKQTLSLIGLTVLLASATQASQEQLAKSIQDVRQETLQTSEQLKSTLGALNGLTKQTKGDLRPAYDIFCSQTAKTEAAAVATRNRGEWMAGEGRRYFQNWQGTVQAIANPSLKKKAQKRLDSVKDDYLKVESALKLASDKFKPFLSDLTDIQKSLATDVTAGGVKAIRGTVKTANWNHQYVNDAINSALKGMDKMAKALSPEVN
jgi:septal ring factor EnvC (AmiA/AmiB activator)